MRPLRARKCRVSRLTSVLLDKYCGKCTTWTTRTVRKKSLSRLNQGFFAPGQKCPLQQAGRDYKLPKKVQPLHPHLILLWSRGLLESWQEMLIAGEGWCIQLPPSQTVGEASKAVKSHFSWNIYIISSGTSNYGKIKIRLLTKYPGSLESQ